MILNDNTFNSKWANVLQKLQGKVWIDADLTRSFEKLFGAPPGTLRGRLPPGLLGFGSNQSTACEGDEGGALVCPSKSKPGQFDIVGIDSRGDAACEGRLPSILVEVTRFLPWIKAHMQ